MHANNLSKVVTESKVAYPVHSATAKPQMSLAGPCGTLSNRPHAAPYTVDNSVGSTAL